MICIMIELVVMNLVHVISESVSENGSSKWFNISKNFLRPMGLLS
jgi:hypothetical protein